MPLLGPGVFVLREIARLQRALPARLVALGPLLRRIDGRARIVAPGLGVRLALVLALLVDDDLLALAAAGEAGDADCRRRGQRNGTKPHDFLPAGGCAWGLSGLP